MKRIMTTLAVMVMIVASAAAMNFSKARTEAYFLTDKMAYELSLSTSQMDAVYEINLDYLMALNSPADLEGIYWMRRNSDLRYVLSHWQWDLYTQILDFYRPMFWVSGNRFALYVRNRYTRHHDFYFNRPTIYGSYRGGHNSGSHSHYANRNYGAPTAPPSYPNNHSTHRSGSNHNDHGHDMANHHDGRSANAGQHGNSGQHGNAGQHAGNNGNPGSNRGNVGTGSSRGNNPNTGRGTVTNEGRNTTASSTSGRSAGGNVSTSSSSTRSGGSSSSTRSGGSSSSTSRSGSSRGGR